MKKKTKITLTITGSLLAVAFGVAMYIAHMVHKSIVDYYFPEKDPTKEYLDPWNADPNVIKPTSEPSNGEVRETPLEIINEAM